MRVVDLITKKKQGEGLDADEIAFLVEGFARDEIPDYQVAAFLMAVCWRGMTPQETTDLTLAMARSGELLDLRGVAAVVADKHSTGGVGDKTSLVVAPLVAAAGVPVAKMSGRGLGFSGGTLDKLESFTGFRVQLAKGQLLDQLERHGIVLCGQTAELVPADAKLYALRDVTATVDSVPLIASSVMSKKIAGGANAIVLDVKTGSGAFMATLAEAGQLAGLMVEIGRECGRKIAAIVSDMSQPLGYAVGNALEVKEAIQTLQGGGPPDLRELCLTLAGRLLALAGVADSPQQGMSTAEKLLRSGRPLAKLAELVGAQGGDPHAVEQPSLLPAAPVVRTLVAQRAGYVQAVDARTVGLAAVALGAGRARKGDAIDHRVGFVLRVKVGDEVRAGDRLIEIHAASEAQALRIEPAVAAAFEVGQGPAQGPVLVHAVVEWPE